MTEISTSALSVLAQVQVNGAAAVLPPGQLDRKVYAEVDKALSLLGGKWSRKERAHLFAVDPSDLLADVVETGRMPDDMDKLMSFWPTPRPLAEEMVRWCGSGLAGASGSTWLEPSAGDGAIVNVIRALFPEVSVVCVEPDQGRCQKLPADDRCEPILDTFQRFAEGNYPLGAARYDAVVMNPPFTEPGSPRAWVEHVTLAYGLLVPGGRLAAIVPSSVEHSSVRAVAAFREWATAAGGSWEMHAPGAFKESGTGAGTALLTVVAR